MWRMRRTVCLASPDCRPCLHTGETYSGAAMSVRQGWIVLGAFLGLAVWAQEAIILDFKMITS